MISEAVVTGSSGSVGRRFPPPELTATRIVWFRNELTGGMFYVMETHRIGVKP